MNQRPIRTLIVDDEKYSREELIFLLQAYSEIEIIGQASTGHEAVAKIIELQPELLFLDIEMPGMTGTEVASVLKEMQSPPYVIFATAYPQFAVEAFQVQAKGYLLKPIDESQLTETIEHIKTLKLSTTGQLETTEVSQGKLAVETEGSIIFLAPEQIQFVYRDDKSTKVVTSEHSYETKMTLKELEARLTPFSFFRVHKSYLVNTSYITGMNPWFNGAYQLQLRGSTEQIPVSRNYVKPLRAKIEL
ncbi:LytR/AlgR family response regulator transcription factor [Alkalihalobacillus sp. 1P02AB]|uniref:LytR/AlgR family response regulator transcription factor n=1 Tax=Alkalihalobacillus sp. 1P02AB TaxID=3132260 RepID=UPI0039A42B30